LIFDPAEAQWVKTAGIEGGQINALGVKGDTTFAGTWGGGVFSSTNQGTSWTYSGLVGEKIRSMAVQGTNIFAGTHTGVYRSTDNGVTWAAANNGTQSLDYIYAMDTSGTYLLAAGSGGISRTSDGGATWTLDTVGLTTPEVPIPFVGAIAGWSGNLFCSMPGTGVFRSTDDGSHWSIVDTATLGNKAVRALAIIDTDLFAGTDGGVFHSTNNGVSWMEFNTGWTIPHVNALAIKGTTIFAGTAGGGVYKTSVASAGWTAVNAGLGDLTALSLIVNTKLFVGTNGGVFSTTDNGAVWTIANSGLTATRVYAIAASGDTLYAGAYGSGLFRSTDDGVTWSNTGISNKYVHALLLNGSFVGVGSEGGFFFSTNSGSTWNAASTGLGIADGHDVRALAVSGTSLYAGVFYGGMFASSDGGVTWNPTTGSGPVNITSLVWSGSILFAGTQGQVGGVFRSSDNGANWTVVNSGLADLDVNAMAIEGNTLFAGTGEGLFKSTDNGNSWTDITGDLGANFILSIQPSGTNLFVGTRNGGGLFYTRNYAPPYSNVGSAAGLTTTWVSSMAIGSKELYLGISGGGVWKRPLVEMGYQIHADVKVYLQGPYVTLGDSMALTLKTTGTLATHFVGQQIPELAVDSINIEIRDSSIAAKATVRKFAPAWLLSDGTIRNFADTSKVYVDFDSVLAGMYYLVVRHRNHLGVMSHDPVALSAGSALYDFTSGLGQYYGSDACFLATDTYGLWGGDADASGDVVAQDRTETWNKRNQAGYLLSDVDLSGDVVALDRTMTWNNRNKSSQVP